ncbi:hypothetical protein QF046_002616 [Microbacterium sp. W4I4]|uniref:hypothetical protein n=1 Tax=Microbacterium sp. W4I4 TaxID=3042295 RepID=UPI00277D7B02|nr:hypothetical protein [Microbacterium sp. W4I4]MDQ0614975.1 hypothetical protein [Microbacterium sp. W4I4]
MKGKIGLVVGFGAGYVFGTRAGRARYEQIKKQWLKVWHLDPVQLQVTRVQEYAKAQVAAVPAALWTGAVKVVKAASAAGTPEQRLHSAVDATKDAADDVADTVKDAAADAERTTKAKTAAKPAATPKPAAKSKSAAKKTTPEAE